MPTNFVSYENAQSLMGAIGQKFDDLGKGYTFRGTVTFANLPATLTTAMAGYVYNVSNAFTTDARFVEGAGHEINAGANVAVADLSYDEYNAVTPVGTENPSEEGWYELDGSSYVPTQDTEIASGKTYYAKTTVTDLKFDILAGFIDMSGINGRIDTLAGSLADVFSTSEAYSIGDVVIYEDQLYKFDSAHVAGVWDSTEVHAITMESLLSAVEPDSLTTAQVNALLALLN